MNSSAFREAKDATLKGVEAMSEVVDELRRELIEAHVTIKQLEATVLTLSGKSLPADPDLQPDDPDAPVDMRNVGGQIAPPALVAPYAKNEERLCMHCRVYATHAVIRQLKPLDLIAFTCKSHAKGGLGKHVLTMRVYNNLCAEQQAPPVV